MNQHRVESESNTETVVQIDGMSCGSGVGRVEKILKPGVTGAAVTFASETAIVSHLAYWKLRGRIGDTGFYCRDG